MGFFNYYLSIGLACFVLGLLWRSRAGNWPWALLATPLVLLAHPIGFLWLLGTLAYRFLRARLPGWWKLMLPLGTLAGFVGIHWYLSCCATFPVDWDHRALYLLTGADQLHLFGDRYATLSWCVLAFVALSAALELAAQRKRKRRWLRLVALLELYAVALFSTALLPENLRPSVTAGWIGLLVSRLSTITAILGLCVLALFRPSKLHLTGFAALAAVFFAFLYQDTAWLSRLESNAVATLATLPKGTRIIPAIEAAPDSRITFVGHIADRACIGRCFSYSNYEPPSKQFRVRVRAEGSPLVSASEDDAENMEGGGYEVKNSDPPLQLLYQCQPADLSKLCLRPLHPGELTDPAAVQESSPP
jgi:hypothetical protein